MKIESSHEKYDKNTEILSSAKIHYFNCKEESVTKLWESVGSRYVNRTVIYVSLVFLVGSAAKRRASQAPLSLPPLLWHSRGHIRGTEQLICQALNLL